MALIEQLQEYRSSTTDLPIAMIGRRVAEIANRLNLRIDRWEEDGLGFAQGMIIRLASGKVILLRELEHLIEYHRIKGPEICFESRDLAKFGVSRFLRKRWRPLISPEMNLIGLRRKNSEKSLSTSRQERIGGWQRGQPN